VKLVGGDAVQPLVLAAGAVADSVILYPVTPTLSEAEMTLMGTARESEVAGMVKAVTVGAVVSGPDPGVIVIVVVALRLADTLPAASLAHA